MKPYSVTRVTAASIRARYRELNPSGHWFDKDTMRFFKTEMPAHGYLDLDGSVWFITGETNPSNEKRYTIRRMDLLGDMHTEGGFHRFDTRDEANEELHKTLRKGETA